MSKKKHLYIVMCLILALVSGLVAEPEASLAKRAASAATKTKKISIQAGKKKDLKSRAIVRKFFGKKALAKGGKKIQWTSSKKKVATVSKKGVVKARKKGKAVVRAKYGKKVIRFRVTVKAKKKTKTQSDADKTKAPSSTAPTSATPSSTAPASTAPAGNGSTETTPPSGDKPGVTGPSEQPASTPTPVPTPVPKLERPLKELYQSSFMVGAAINGSSTDTAAIRHEGMAKILKTHFNSTTLSNLMKPMYLLDESACREAAARDGEDVTEVDVKFDTCEESLRFCRDNNISMRGHVLVWHDQTPEWFFKKGYDADNEYVSKEVMEKRMENYIKNVLEYCQTNYPGVIYCWDVVNECVDFANPDTTDGWSCRTMFNGKTTHWYQTMGIDYVYKAFEYARKYADPEVKLIYNDFNVFQPAKRDSICTLLRILKKKGIIDGVGLQPTVLLSYPSQLKGDSDDSFETCLRAYGATGLDIQVTELSFEIPSSMERSEANLKRQADRYQEMYELLLAMDDDNGGPCHITSVSVFGICDDYPLYDNHRQCLYLWNKDCTPKEALYRIYLLGETYADTGGLTLSGT
ncbi:MAG: endo-1,4-beta-xylanase [Lachnospiraceae bacterium]|nr:endo-1,4-beta-xylanase [Lachnospiraceae bacterium]